MRDEVTALSPWNGRERSARDGPDQSFPFQLSASAKMRLFHSLFLSGLILLGVDGVDHPLSHASHHELAQMRRLEHELSRLWSAAASLANLHSSAAAARVLGHETKLKKLRADIWSKWWTNGSDRRGNMTLAEARDMLKHRLYTDTTLSPEDRTSVNSKLIQVLRLSGKRGWL